MAQLVLLGGPTGVGKSTTVTRLAGRSAKTALERLPYPRIDTSRLTPDEVGEAVLAHPASLQSP